MRISKEQLAFVVARAYRAGAQRMVDYCDPPRRDEAGYAVGLPSSLRQGEHSETLIEGLELPEYLFDVPSEGPPANA